MRRKTKKEEKSIIAEVEKPVEENKFETEKVRNKKNKRKRSKIKVEENGVELESQPAKRPKKEELIQSKNEKNPPKKKIQFVKENKVDVENLTKEKKFWPAKKDSNVDGEEKQNTKVISKNIKRKNLLPSSNDLTENVNMNDNSSIREKPLLPHQIKADREARTIFIGNLPVKFNEKKLNTLVRQYGEIDSIRIRGAIPECDKISKKVAVNKKMFNKDLNCLVAYVVFKSLEDAQNALALNGELFEEHHLRVTLPTEKISDKNKGIFVGNLRYKVTDEEIWDFFKDCGEISSVRVIRDGKTGLCKGFGYVNFKSEDSVEFALKLDGGNLQDREIRIKRLFSEGKLEKLKKKKQQTNVKSNQPNKNTKSKKDETIHNKFGFNKRFKLKTEKSTNNKSKPEFKKKNLSKTDMKKKKLAEKLLAKSKKKAIVS